MTVVIDGSATNYELFTAGGSTQIDAAFNRFVAASVMILDAEDNELHSWGHIPINHKLSTAAGDHLIVPCDEKVVLNLFSYTSDYSELNSTYWGVQHSFWLPEWGVKEDLVPGLEGGTMMWFWPDDPGTFNIRCAEYCGLDHSKMIGNVDVVAPIQNGLDFCDVDSGVQKVGGSN
jgi:heme/copper-type cytochrome/quinol oxidase subunit 2